MDTIITNKPPRQWGYRRELMTPEQRHERRLEQEFNKRTLSSPQFYKYILRSIKLYNIDPTDKSPDVVIAEFQVANKTRWDKIRRQTNIDIGRCSWEYNPATRRWCWE